MMKIISGLLPAVAPRAAWKNRIFYYLPDACIAANAAKSNAKTLRLPSLEMIKGFDIWEQNPKVALPLFDNHADVSQIASEIRARFNKTKPVVSALMIRGHGITVWGKSLQQAYNRVETMEFIMSYMAKA